MADGIIDVQYPVVRNAIEELMNQTQQIITTLNNLEDELKPLVNSWEGSDQETYRQVQAEWLSWIIWISSPLSPRSLAMFLVAWSHSAWT